MNYIKQLNAFYDWLLLNPISAKEQALYLAILHLNNKSGWREEFTIANQTLQAICSMSRSELHKLRNKLEQIGLIEYQRGKKNQAGKYKICFLYETNTETNVETHMETNQDTHVETNVETNMEHITKHKQNKTKQGNIYRRKYIYDDSHMELAKRFYQNILQNNPNHKKPNFGKWADDIRKMIEIDNRTEEQIAYLIDWVQQDEFEMTNVLSPDKLRKRFDQLAMKVKREHRKTVLSGQRSSTKMPKAYESLKEWAEGEVV